MASVFFMKFNRDQGALVADEMTWHLSFKYGYRPTRYGDSILNLLKEDVSKKNEFAAVYAGTGFPSLHFEVARKAAKKIPTEPGCIGDLEKTATLVQDTYQTAHGRMINDKLRFLLGFNRDEMNTGSFEMGGKKIEINQEALINEARKMLKYQDKADAFHRIFDNEGLVMGYDKKMGIRAYHVEHDGLGLDFAYPFDAIGPGKEIGTKIFADSNYRLNLDSRRKGYAFTDGLFLLLYAFTEACDFSSKLGGYTQIFLIDGKRDTIKEMTREITDHRGHLSSEIMRAYRWGFLTKESAQSFINRLLIENDDWEAVEKDMFEASGSDAILRKHLMGFKPSNTPKMPLT